MNDIVGAIGTAIHLIFHGDAVLGQIVLLSLRVSLSAVAIAGVIGLPCGAALALARFPGRGGVIVVLNAMMGLPPVVAGLVVYVMLSRTGPLGVLGILFTPAAMIVAQTILVVPIIAALTRQVVADLWEEYREHLQSLGVTARRAALTLLWDARYSLITTILAGTGRAMAEVGSIIIVGGNIAGFTRTMTTAIALETSRGDLPLALGLGIILLLLTLVVNAAAHLVGAAARQSAG